MSSLFKLSEIELSYKTAQSYRDRHNIKNSKDASVLFKENWNMSKIEFIEQANMILLNRANQALGMYHLSSGGTAATVIDIKQVFMAALKGNACGIVIAHNHPSGNLTPSETDKELTARLYKAGLILDISILDHLIITKDGYYSFADNGLLQLEY